MSDPMPSSSQTSRPCQCQCPNNIRYGMPMTINCPGISNGNRNRNSNRQSQLPHCHTMHTYMQLVASLRSQNSTWGDVFFQDLQHFALVWCWVRCRLPAFRAFVFQLEPFILFFDGVFGRTCIYGWHVHVHGICILELHWSKE